MNNKALSLSLVMAVLAVFFVYSYVNSIEEEAKRKFGTEVTVLEAKRDIKEMETINETMLELVAMPKKFKEPAAVYWETRDTQSKEVTKGVKSLAGMVAIVPIKKGEQITMNKVIEPSLRTGLAPQIAPGRRAFAIKVDETTSVSKLVKPGDRVDLIAVMDMGGGKENKVAKTVLQDAVILSVGRAVTNNLARMVEADTFTGAQKVRSLVDDTNFTSVSLEVTPQQAQALALVVGESVLTLSLRNNDDTDRSEMGSTSFADVLGQDAAKLRLPASKR